MMAISVARGSSFLRCSLLHKVKQGLFCTSMRGLSSDTDPAQDEYKYETLTGDLEGKIL